MDKLEWCGYPMGKKCDDTFSCFNTIPACDRQTDRQKDILPRHSSRSYVEHQTVKKRLVGKLAANFKTCKLYNV